MKLILSCSYVCNDHVLLGLSLELDSALITLLVHAPGSPLTLHKMSSVDLMYQATPTISLSLAEVEVRLQELGLLRHSFDDSSSCKSVRRAGSWTRQINNYILIWKNILLCSFNRPLTLALIRRAWSSIFSSPGRPTNGRTLYHHSIFRNNSTPNYHLLNQ